MDVPHLRKLRGQVLLSDSVMEGSQFDDYVAGIRRCQVVLNACRLELEGAPKIVAMVEDVRGWNKAHKERMRWWGHAR